MIFIRLYTSLSSDLDFQMLENEQRLAWYEILLFAAEKGGQAPSAKAMGRKWGKSETAALDLMQPLVEREWIVIHPGFIEVTNWAERQAEPKNPKAAQRQKRYRERLKSVTVTSPLRNGYHNGVTRDVLDNITGRSDNRDPCPTLSQETPGAHASPAREGQGRAGKYVDLAAWVPGWYCTDGFRPNPDAKVIGYAIKAATEEQILEVLQEPTGIARLATMAARGWSEDASEGVVKQLLLEIVKDSQRSKR